MRTLLTAIALFFSFTCLLAQAPQGLNYQAIARDASGQPQAMQPLSVIFDILDGSSGGPVIFNEAHSTTTLSSGLFNLSIGSINTATFSAINWGSGPKFLRVTVNGVTGGATQMLSVPYALFAERSANGGSLTAGSGITINGGVISATDNSASNEIQTLSLVGNQLSLSNGGGSVTLSGGTDSQTLAINGNQLSITNGNSVNLPQDGDGNSTNELQTLNLSGNQLSLSNGGGSVTLSGGTDSQNLSVNGNRLSISNGNSVTIDGSTTNEIQALSLSGNQLSLSNGGGSVTLSGGTDSQTLAVNGNQLTISNGNSIILPQDGDGSATNEIQTISLSGNQLSLSNGGGAIILPPDADGNPTNEIQTISLSGSQLSLSNGGGTVSLASGTDSQTLTLNGNQLSITNGNSVNLPQDGDGSATNEIQTLSLSGNQLSLSNGGGAVTLSQGTDAQTLAIMGNQLSISNGNSVSLPASPILTAGNGININNNIISNTGDLSNNNELQSLTLNGNQLSISSGNSVTLASAPTYAAGSGISISGNIISNTGDNDNNPTNEIQQLGLNGNNLTISGNGGNSVMLPIPDVYIIQNVGPPGTTCGAGFLPFDCTQCSPGFSSFKVTNACDGNAIHGVASSSAGIKAGVFGEALGFNGNGTWGECNNGPWAWGLYGTTSSGYGVVGWSSASAQADGLFGDRIIATAANQPGNLVNWATSGFPFATFSAFGSSNTSDKRLKKNIEPIKYGLSEVLSMQPVSFNWKVDEKNEHGRSLGFIAQDMQALVPDVVVQPTEEEIKASNAQASSEGKGGLSGDPVLGMKYTELIPVLVKAIQEQQAQIEDLKAQVKAGSEETEQLRQQVARLEKEGGQSGGKK